MTVFARIFKSPYITKMWLLAMFSSISGPLDQALLKNPGKAHSPPASPAPQLCLSYLSAFSGWLILCKDMECNLPHLATPGTYTRKNLKHNGDTLGPRQDLLWCRFIEQTVESYSEATAVEPRTKVTSRTD